MGGGLTTTTIPGGGGGGWGNSGGTMAIADWMTTTGRDGKVGHRGRRRSAVRTGGGLTTTTMPANQMTMTGCDGGVSRPDQTTSTVHDGGVVCCGRRRSSALGIVGAEREGTRFGVDAPRTVVASTSQGGWQQLLHPTCLTTIANRTEDTTATTTTMKPVQQPTIMMVSIIHLDYIPILLPFPPNPSPYLHHLTHSPFFLLPLQI